MIEVYAPSIYGLPEMYTTAQYHCDAGWCIDELRIVTHWRPLKNAGEMQ